MTRLRTMGHIGGSSALVVATVAGSLMMGASTFAASNTSGTAASSTAAGTKLSTIIAKGDAEINRRLASLTTLSSKISGATKLSASDKTTLTNEVATTTSGLTALKTKLDAETTASAAVTDAKDIYTEYRVYALVLPKVNLIKSADDQQTAETKLSALADTLQTRIQTAAGKGKDMSVEQAKLADMRTQLSASTPVSSSMESSVISLQPSDYNSDHALLSGDRDKLKTAHTANVAALADAKAIVSALKALS